MITERNGRFYDDLNNSWSTREDAERYSPTLVNCSGCSDCSRCSDCSDCSRCSRCSGCSDCSSVSASLRCLKWSARLISPGTVAVGCQTHSIKEWLNPACKTIPWAAHCSKAEVAYVRKVVRALAAIDSLCWPKVEKEA